MDIASFANAIGFRDVQPDTPAQTPDGLSFGPEERRLELENTVLPEDGDELRGRLEGLLEVPRMSTFAIAAIINRIVGALAPGHAFVNVGVWHGFSLLAGMAGHPETRCVGVDNFSEFDGPREAFLARFAERRSEAHTFVETDYRSYFAWGHAGPVGFYFYDGNHEYEHQLAGLRAAERFFAPECWVLVDDVNWEAPRRATVDFVAASARRWETVLDRTTAHNQHPTWWNGVLLLRSTSSRDPASNMVSSSGAPEDGARTA